MICASNARRVRDFCLLPKVQTNSGAHLVHYTRADHLIPGLIFV